MTREKQRWVITGGPGTGKSTLLNSIRQSGYPVFEEISREWIRRALDEGTDLLPWKDLQGFSYLIWKERKKQFEAAPNGPSFYDRSLLDTIAYLEILDPKRIPEKWEETLRMDHYMKDVFITPPWKEIHILDNERRESWTEVEGIHHQLCSTYKRFGYRIIEVPRSDIETRTKFILQHLKVA